MADRERDVVLNFRTNGEVQYAQTLKQINMVMQTAAKEYTNHIAAMGRDASVTEKLRAEKRKLETQLGASSEKVRMLREEFEEMQNDTNATAEDLQKLYNKLLSAENAHTKLEQAMERVNAGLSEEAIAARDAGDKLKSLKDENKLLEAEQKNLESAFRLQRSELGENASETERLELAQRQLREQSEMTEKVIGNLEKQLEQAKLAYGENSVQVIQLETRINDARTTLRNFSNQLSGVADSSGEAGDGLAELGNKMDLNNLMEATELLSGVTDKLLEVGSAAFESALSIGDSQTLLQANLGVTAEKAEELNEVVNNVFKNGVVGSVEEATEAVSMIKSSFADLNNADLEKLTNKITTIAKRTGTDVSGNVIAAQKMMDEFGITGEQAMDLIAAGYQDNLNKSGDFLDTLNEYSPHFEAAGYSADQMMQIIKNGMENGALNTDIAADAIKELQIRMGDGSFESVVEGFSKGTQNVFKEWKKGKATVADVAASVNKDLNKMKPTEQQEALSLLASQFEDLGVDGAKALFSVGDAFKDVSGKADEMSKKSPGEDWESSLRELRDSIVPIGQQLVEGLKPVVDKIADLGQWFKRLPEPIQTFVASFGGILAVITLLTPIIVGIIGAFAVLGSTLGIIIAVVVGVAAAIAGIIVVIKNWGSITDWLSEKWNQFTNWLSESTSNLAKNFIKWFFEMKNGAVNKFNELKDGVVQKVTDLKNRAIETIASFVGNGIQKVSELKSNFTNKIDELKNGAISKFNNLRDRAGEVMHSMKEKILSPIHDARDAVKTAVEKMRGFFNFNWKLPSIKMPKFSVSGSANPLDWIKEGVPKLSVKWNARGGIFTRPTIFGENNGQLQGAGERDPEGLIPLNKETLGAIGKGIASTMQQSSGNNSPIILQVDGKTFAQIIGPYTDAEGGVQIRRIDRGLA